MPTLQDVYKDLTEKLALLIKAEAAVVCLYESKSGEMRAQIPAYGIDNDLLASFHFSVRALSSDWNLWKFETFVVNDSAAIPTCLEPFSLALGTKSLIASRMLVENHVVGILFVFNKLTGFSQEDAWLLKSIASLVGAQIENLRLYQATVEAAERQSVLYQTSQAIGRSLDPEQIYRAIHQAVSQLISSDVVVIALKDERQEVIDLVYMAAREERFPPAQIPLGEGLSSYIITTGKTLYAADFHNENLGIEPVRFGRTKHVASVLAVPLRLGNKIVGMLSVQSYQPSNYTTEDQHVLEILANQTASALENARLFDKVSASSERMQELAQQIVTTQELERKRIAHEIHDEVGQKLSMLKLHLQMLAKRLPEDYTPQITDAVKLTNTILEDIRRTSHGLQPPTIDKGALIPALKTLCYDFGEYTGINVDYQELGAPVPQSISGNLGITVYRVLQESLNNVARHAEADKVRVILENFNDELRLQIRDNGKGFDLKRLGSAVSFGVEGMRERLEILGGRLQIESEPNQGTKVTAVLPFNTTN